MVALIFLVLNLAASLFKPRWRLEAENAALRQQLIVLQRKVRGQGRALIWRMWRAPLQDVELVAQDQDVGFQPLSRLEAVAQHANEQEADCNHSAIMV
jgi:hypothetical protein